MFNKGDYIVHGSSGTCRVEEITHIDLPGSDKDRLYYCLLPVYGGNSKVYTPVDSDKVPMRRILTKQEAEQLLSDIPKIETMEAPGEKFREDSYKEVMKKIDCRSCVSMMKMLFQKRKTRLAEGRKFTAVDERYLKAAEDSLFTELAVVFEEDREEAQKRFIQSISLCEFD